MKKIFFYLILLILPLLSICQSVKYSKVKIYTGENGLKNLNMLGIPLEGEIKKDTYIILEISENDIKKLNDNAFTYDIITPDLSSFYVSRNKNSEKNNSKSKSSYCNNTTPVYQTPTHFVLGSMGGFYTYDEMLTQLNNMRTYFPNLITVKQQIGTQTTIENRPLYYVKISDNPDVDENEPEVLYSALTHAREPMGMQQLIFYMWYLLENYNSSTEIHQLLDNTELYFVPCVNADGYCYNQTTDPYGGGMWRKNRRNNGGGSFGIDLNRNYGYMWGYDDDGSSSTTSDETYRGTAAFSEPETQIMKWFCENHNFALSIDYHCFGNYLLYPWGYDYNLLTPDSTLYIAYSKLMTKENGYMYGTVDQTLGYITNGGSFDWFYGEQISKNKIISLSPEIGNGNDGFWPESSRIEEIAKENILQNLYIARFAGKYAAITDLTPRIIEQTTNYFKFDIQCLGLETNSATFTVSLNPISSNIVNMGSPKVFTGMNLLETLSDSIAFSLNSAIQNGDIVSFVASVNNGLFTVNDTINKIYGTTVSLFLDTCNTITNWQSNEWGVTTTQYHSAPSSINDSPFGDYQNNINESITLNVSIDLTNAVTANLKFWTKWSIESFFDYAQVKASKNDGTTWIPLCGKYTKQESNNDLYDEPYYDGTQNNWVLEDIDLSDFVGYNIKLRFTLVSDSYLTKDGFFFDDLSVTKIDHSNNSITENIELGDFFISDPIPNPTNDNVYIKYSMPNNSGVFKIYNINGQLIYSKNINTKSGDIIFDVKNYEKGVYYYSIENANSTITPKTLIVN